MFVHRCRNGGTLPRPVRAAVVAVVVRPAAGSIAGSILRYCLCSRCRGGGGRGAGGGVGGCPARSGDSTLSISDPTSDWNQGPGGRGWFQQTRSSPVPRSVEVLAIMTLFIFKRIILIFEIKSNISFTDKNNINFVLYGDKDM